MKLNENHDYVLSTGKIVSCNMGILGISEFNGSIQLFEGYDSDLYEERDLTKEEKLELADYAIALWNKYKAEIK
jgi:hypothetical protein